ncbi:hypothetical protein [Lacticaseibacillus brantae]|uniref:Uncharacterized protein n=1 Tax=Lacticaseibacillus brantae DSM 23927 TaxID=1423727 RepID=A0A0R2AVQ3_9LACO|nr:hypothetical protein [Lacticaseibacillus brantae]KRM71325.1 hypothetical protein FC34_GL001805 [Lacticaseibacillus brantae DSM 23927]
MAAIKALALPSALTWLTKLNPWLSHQVVNPNQYQLLVASKLTLAGRSQSSLGGMRKKESPHPLRNLFIGYLIVGALLGFFMLIPMNAPLSAGLLMNSLFIMFFLTMLTSFSTLILDPRDQTIFSTHAVDRKTINYARLTVVGIYFAVTIFAMGLPAVVVLGIRLGLLTGLMTALGILLLGLTTLSLSLFLYLLVLRFFDGERLKNILNILQIVIIIAMYVVGQLPNLLPKTDYSFLTTGLDGAFHWYYLVFMPFWFMGPTIMPSVGLTTLTLTLTGLAILAPVILMLIYLRFSTNFETYLIKLDQSSDKARHEGWYFKLTRRLFARQQNAPFFTLGWQLLGVERDFKLRVYPQVAYALIIPGLLLFSFMREAPWTMVSAFVAYIPYFLIMAVPIAVLNLQFSHQPLAMRIFTYVPFAAPGILARGVVSALFFRLLAPLTLVLGVFASVITRGQAIIPTIGGLAMTYAGTLLIGLFVFNHRLPFAQAFSPDNAKGGAVNLVGGIGALIIVAIIVVAGGLIHNLFFDLGITVFWIIIAAVIGRLYTHRAFQPATSEINNE